MAVSATAILHRREVISEEYFIFADAQWSAMAHCYPVEPNWETNMNQQKPDEREIFYEALEYRTSAQVAAYLDAACCGNARVRAKVESLLRAHHDARSFMTSEESGVNRTADSPLVIQPGTVFGPYKLREQIGEGGFGVVYVAEQDKPIRRKVALKVIKPGMDTKDVIARFEAERQALALMDHPNVAKVYDAGTTESGYPYFALELVT
jgi:hypothetical protein